ncbi:MAG TPA: hypothetical protein QGF02_02170 [Candidatus Babeliales bacterium]|nr:hypothetical protein [Candidatus Babeliales bacterium]
MSDAKLEMLTKSITKLSNDVAQEGTDIAKMLAQLDNIFDEVSVSKERFV